MYNLDEGYTLNVVDFPFALSDLNEVFEVSNFLDNQEALVEKFRPEVIKYLERAKYFPAGVMSLAYEAAFEDLIVGLIRKEITNHFNFDPEKILLLTQPDVIDMLSGGYFFEIKNYLK